MDDLINKIITEVGVALPKYDYGSKKFIIEVPINISTGIGAVGSFAKGHYDTFSEACEGILEWHKTTKG